MIDYVIIEYVIYPDGREFLLIGERVYKRPHGQDWEPIDPDFFNKSKVARNALVQGVLIGEVSREQYSS